MTAHTPLSLLKASIAHYRKHPFNIKKRTTRAEYWPCFLVSFTLLCALSALMIFLFYLYSLDDQTIYLALGIILYFTLIIAGMAVAIPTITAVIRRLHDTGRSGWWLCISFTIIGYIPLVFFLCQKSQPTANPYGPAPRRRK